MSTEIILEGDFVVLFKIDCHDLSINSFLINNLKFSDSFFEISKL